MLGKRTQDLAGKFEDFEFRDTYFLHFFEKKSEKYKRIAKHITKNTKMVELGFKNDICIGMKFVLFVFSIFSDKKKKKSKC
jgi:hypothetical protein